jgi:hypothetical protein
MNRAFSNQPSDARLISIMQSLMSNVYYGYQTVGFPPFLGGKIGEFLVKPDVPFVAPPRCNTIFPAQVGEFSFRRSYLSEPTRARYSLPVGADPVSDRLFRQHFYAPEQMEGIAREFLAAEGQARNIDGLQMSGDDVVEESREDIKGVIPLISNLQVFDNLVLGGEVGEDDRKVYFSELADHGLKLAQHAPRGMRASGRFNPSLVCGLPGVFLMEHGIVFGNIQSVDHAIHSGGTASTSVVMSHCRDEDLSDLREPVWKNAKYTDPKQLDETYATLFGEGHASILAPIQGLGTLIEAGFSDQTVAAQRLFEAYTVSEDKEAFEAGYTDRSMVRLDELFRFLRANPVGQNYQGGPFREEWAAVAQEVATNLAEPVRDAR